MVLLEGCCEGRRVKTGVCHRDGIGCCRFAGLACAGNAEDKSAQYEGRSNSSMRRPVAATVSEAKWPKTWPAEARSAVNLLLSLNRNMWPVS